MIAETVSKLVGRFEKLKGTETVVRLDHVFAAFSGDIVGNLCCVERVNFLDDENFSPEWCVHGICVIWRLYTLIISKVQFATPHHPIVSSPYRISTNHFVR